MDKEFRERLVDFFDAWELVEYLQVKTEDVVDAFAEEIEECADDLEEFMEIGTRK